MRLIDADAAYERAQADSRRGALEDWEFDMIVNLLDSAPTVDAVPVVRCRDCRFNSGAKKCLNPDSFFAVLSDDDFCSYGELMDGGDPDGR